MRIDDNLATAISIDDNVSRVVADDNLDGSVQRDEWFTELYLNIRIRKSVRWTLLRQAVPLWDLEDVESDVWAYLWRSPFDPTKSTSVAKLGHVYLVRIATGIAKDYHDYHGAAKRSTSRTISLDEIAERDQESNQHTYDRAVNAQHRDRYVAERYSDKPRTFATCHPAKRIMGKGLCSTCYAREYARKLRDKKKERQIYDPAAHTRHG